jgi:hypothetical protein
MIDACIGVQGRVTIWPIRRPVGLRLGSWLKVYNLEIDIGHRS